MKVRVTLMTENNKHINEDISDYEVQKIAEDAWLLFITALNEKTGEDKAYLEKVEVVER